MRQTPTSRKGGNTTTGNELGDPQQMTGDDEALDLVGALVDLHELGITHIFFEGQVLHITVTAEDLYRISGHTHGDIGGKHFAKDDSLLLDAPGR